MHGKSPRRLGPITSNVAVSWLVFKIAEKYQKPKSSHIHGSSFTVAVTLTVTRDHGLTSALTTCQRASHCLEGLFNVRILTEPIKILTDQLRL